MTNSKPFSSTQFGSLAGLVGSSGIQVQLLLPSRSVRTFPSASKVMTVAFAAIGSGAADSALSIISSSVLGGVWPAPTPCPAAPVDQATNTASPQRVDIDDMRMSPSFKSV